jgi:mannose-6-phosphate isomerase-like protein (cupin superfamily)
MQTRRLHEAPRNVRGGQVSYLMLGKGDFGSEHIAMSWVGGERGTEQQRHEHPESEQVYLIIAGRGLVFVGEESEEVHAGTLVLVPPSTPHSIRSIGPQTLQYITATSPPVDPQPSDPPSAYR